MANVFISHRRVDVEPAEKLAAQVRDAGHRVWFDEWEIGIGDSIVGRMNEGLEGSPTSCFVIPSTASMHRGSGASGCPRWRVR